MRILILFMSALLILLSLVLLHAGLDGREGVLRIGRETVAERGMEPETDVRPTNPASVVAGTIGFLVGLMTILILTA